MKNAEDGLAASLDGAEQACLQGAARDAAARSGCTCPPPRQNPAGPLSARRRPAAAGTRELCGAQRARVKTEPRSPSLRVWCLHDERGSGRPGLRLAPSSGNRPAAPPAGPRGVCLCPELAEVLVPRVCRPFAPRPLLPPGGLCLPLYDAFRRSEWVFSLRLESNSSVFPGGCSWTT